MQWDFVVIVDGGGGGGAVPRRNIGELCRDGDGTRAPPLPYRTSSVDADANWPIFQPRRIAEAAERLLRRVFFLLPIAGHVSADFNGLQLDDGST